MKKRLLGILICLCMVCALLPATALAKEAHSHTDWTALTGVDGSGNVTAGGSTDLYNNYLTNGSYYLTADLSGVTTLRIAGNVTLCLNGHNITSNADPVIMVGYDDTLTICNCQSSGTISGGGARTILNNGGTLTLESGTVTNGFTGGTAVRSTNYFGDLTPPVFNMNGGMVSATGSNGTGVYNYNATANITNGTVSATSGEGRGVYNSGTLCLSGGSVSGSKYGIHNAYYNSKVYLSGTPAVGGDTVDIYTNGSSSMIYANDGAAESPAAYSGEALSLGYSGYTDGSACVHNVTDATQDKFTLVNSGTCTLEYRSEDNKLNMKKPTPTADKFNITAPTAKDYTGSPISVTKPTAKETGMGTVTVYYEGAGGIEYSKSATAPTNAGSYTVTFDVAESDNYASATGLSVGALTINKVGYTGTTTASDTVRSGKATTDKALTLPALPAGASYGSPTVGGTTPALISTPIVSDTTLTYSATSQAAGTGATITIPVTGATNFNQYDFVVTVTAVAKTELAISGVAMGGNSYTYGGAAVTYNTENLSITGGPTVELEYIYSGTPYDNSTFTSGTAAPTKAGSYKLTAQVPDSNEDYTGKQEIEFTIGKKPVTITGLSASGKVYDGNATADVTGTAEVSGKLDGDTVTVTDGTASFAGKNAGTGKTVTFTGYSLGGADAANYELTAQPASVTADITAKAIAITGVTANNRAYAPGDLAVSLTGGSVDALDGDTVTVDLSAATGTIVDANVGDNKPVTITGVKLGGADAGNYSLSAQPSGVTVNITPAAHDNETAVGSAKYGAAGTVDLSSLIVEDGTATYQSHTATNNALDGTPSVSGKTLNFKFADDAALATKTEEIVVQVCSANYENYTVTVTVTVADKPAPTVTAPTAITGLVYNGGDQALIEAARTTGGTLQYSLDNSNWSSDLPKAANAATYTVYYRVVGNDEYADVAASSISVTVSPKAVTAAPKDITITKGNAIPAFELVYTGLIGDDTLTPDEIPAFACFEADGTTAVGTGTAAGTYTIIWTNADSVDFASTNYAVSKTAEATLAIENPAPSGGSYTPPTYKVESGAAEEADGSVSLSTGSAKEGDTVTITVTPDAYYQVEEVIVKDRSGNIIEVTENEDGTFSFEMPASQVTVEPVFSWDNPFEDVAAGAFYTDAVEWALKNGVAFVPDENTFAPNASGTRAQMVTFLWRSAGCPEPAIADCGFADVDVDSYYGKAVLWAVENGITVGTSSTTFSPHAKCTRAQMATFLFRMAGGEAVSGESAFVDVDPDAYYAEAVQWAYENGITVGTGGNKYSPDAAGTRGQIVTFLWRYCN